MYRRTRGRESAWTFTKPGSKETPITYKAYGGGEVRITGAETLSADGWKHIKGAISLDPQAGVVGVFRNGFPLVGHGSNHPVPSVEAVYPNADCDRVGPLALAQPGPTGGFQYQSGARARLGVALSQLHAFQSSPKQEIPRLKMPVPRAIAAASPNPPVPHLPKPALSPNF